MVWQPACSRRCSASGQYPARAGAAFVVSAMCCAGAGRDVPDGGDAECVDQRLRLLAAGDPVKYATAGALVAGDGDGNAGGRVRQLFAVG